MQHRFAYVGNDLQDIYGIDPLHLGEATTLSDAFFADNNAQANLSKLASTPDGVLVSLETAKDFQLQLGDEIKLRLQQAGDHQYHEVSFHYIGIIKKFPSAPKDSFLVTNASYMAAQTGSKTSEVVLMKVDSNPKQVAITAKKLVTDLSGVKVTDVSSVQDRISSSLTSVNLQGLTRLELAFALLFAIGTTGLIVSLGMTERRRTYAILKALGAKQNQLGAFLWSEGILVFGSGVVLGLVLGFGVAQMLVKVLTGVFDPPPTHLFIPWTYVTVLLVVGFGSMIAAVYGAILNSRKQVVQTLRGL
jgi:putative ABC transport system permease protein